MKFNNVVLWCKGWYRKRGNITTWWMDLIHCFRADGKYIYTKNDVAKCITLLMDDNKDIFNDSYFAMFDFIATSKIIYKEKGADDIDLLINYFRYKVEFADAKNFTGDFYLASSDVLPTIENYAQLKNGKPQHLINPNYQYWNTFEGIESSIKNKRWQDVLAYSVFPEDIYNKIVLSGSKLMSDPLGISIKMFGEPALLYMDIYSNCKNFDPNSKYIVYYERNADDDYLTYIVKYITLK